MMKTSIALMSLGVAMGQDAAACTDSTDAARTPYENLKWAVSKLNPIVTSAEYATAAKKDACIDQPAEPACVVSATNAAVGLVFATMDLDYAMWAGVAGATCMACIQNPTGRRLDDHADAEAAEAAAGMAFLACGGIAPMTHDAINALEAPVCTAEAVAVLMAGRRLDDHAVEEEAAEPGLDAAFVAVDAVGVDCFQCTLGVGVQGDADPTAEQLVLMQKCIGEDGMIAMAAADAAANAGGDGDADHADDHADDADDHADDHADDNAGSTDSGDGDNAAGLATFTAMALAFFMW